MVRFQYRMLGIPLLALQIAASGCPGKPPADDAADGGVSDPGRIDGGRPATTDDAGGSQDGGAARADGGARDGGAGVASEARRMLVVLVDHNEQSALSRAEAREQLDGAERHFQRNSCGQLHFEGIDDPATSGDLVNIDVGWLRPACDTDTDCPSSLGDPATCSYDPNPGDGRAEGRCPCQGDVLDAATDAARDLLGEAISDYDDVGVVYGMQQPWLACPPTKLCAASGSGSRWWCVDEVNWHEIGHSIGFPGHANEISDPACYRAGEFGCSVDEYGDWEDIMGVDDGRQGIHSMGLARLMGAGWVRGRVELTRSGTYCVHPFDPPSVDWGPFCADTTTLRGLELDMTDSSFGSQVQVGLRGQTGELKLYESTPGGTRSGTTLLASLGSEGDRFDAEPILLPELDHPFRAGFSVARGPACDGDGVEITVLVDAP